MKEKQSKCSIKCISSFRRLHDDLVQRKLQSIYKRLFTLCSYLKTKESYDRWVTRRVWGFRHQISKEKYLKMSVANIGKLQENTEAVRARGLQNFAAKGQHFRS